MVPSDRAAAEPPRVSDPARRPGMSWPLVPVDCPPRTAGESAESCTALLGTCPSARPSENAECRTSRTVFGAEPRASIRLAKRSTSSVVTADTLRSPSAREMCTRFIDSQFWRYGTAHPRSRSALATGRPSRSPPPPPPARTRPSRPGHAGRLLSLGAREPVGLSRLRIGRSLRFRRCPSAVRQRP